MVYSLTECFTIVSGQSTTTVVPRAWFAVINFYTTKVSFIPPIILKLITTDATTTLVIPIAKCPPPELEGENCL